LEAAMTDGATTGPDRLVIGQRRRAVVASTVGTTIEWYDFFLYGTMAALVFPHLFFPGGSTYSGVLASFATQFVGFAARPIGAAVFGHFGDRIGRKTTLVTTLVLMGIATFLMGLLPGRAAIGVAAPIILVLLRILQGVGVGGEWGGSVLLPMERGSQRRRCCCRDVRNRLRCRNTMRPSSVPPPPRREARAESSLRDG
jgi:MFS family permease